MFRHGLVAIGAGALLAACGQGEAPQAPGIDAARKVVTIGTLNDESGPVAAIGKPWAIGKRILARHLNAGGTGLLPPGWTVALLERDHGYDAQLALRQLDEIRGKVLYLGHSFGTPITVALRARLRGDGLVAYPASLASRMAEFAWTPPLGPSYRLEAMRALDWAVDSAGGAAKVRAGLVYQLDDYGNDSRDGWVQAADAQAVARVAEQGYGPEQQDFTRLVIGLKHAGATHVLLATVPSATGPILAAAAALDYRPQWIGNSPSWSDRFFDPTVIPAAVFERYHWLTAFAVWGEDVPFMKNFLAAYDKYGREAFAPDLNILWSYGQGLTGIEVTRRMIESGDLSRAGYLKALQALDRYDIEGALAEPLDFSRLPYVAGTRTRVLKPDFGKRGWKAAAPYARPRLLATSAPP